MSLELYRNMLRYAHSHECPVEERTKVIEGANDIINAHYKSWADSQPDPFAYDVVKKEAFGYDTYGKAIAPILPKKATRLAKSTRPMVWFYQINAETNRTVAKYRTLEEAATKLGGQIGNISHAINKRSKIAYGYRWKKRVFNIGF